MFLHIVLFVEIIFLWAVTVCVCVCACVRVCVCVCFSSSVGTEVDDRGNIWRLHILTRSH